MAEAQPKVNPQIAIIPNAPCELCDDKEIKWKCFTCEQYMCDHCKKIHGKIRASKEHRVNAIWGADMQQHDDQEKSDSKCSSHLDEDAILFCKECDVLLCTNCIVEGYHENHTKLKIKDMIGEKQEELSTIIDESSKKLSEFEENMKSMKEIGQKQSSYINQCSEDVKTKYTALTAKLDQIYNETLNILKDTEKQNQEHLNKKEKATENNMAELNDIVNQCKEKQATRVRETELIHFVRDVKQRLKQYKSHPPSEPLDIPIFLSNDVDEGKVKEVFGDLVIDIYDISTYGDLKPAISTTPTINVSRGSTHSEPVPAKAITPTINVSVVSSFHIKKDRVAALNDNQAWVVLAGSSFVQRVELVTSDGEVERTANPDFDVYDLAVTKSGELLATVYGGNKIKKLTSDGRFVDLYVDQSDGCYTKGITVTDNNDILVCLYNDDREEGQVLQLASTGQPTTTIKYDTDGKTMLFDDPWYVSNNRNHDIIVADNFDKVVVVDESGNRRFTYRGQVIITKGLRFCPRYTVTDQYGHIIISDYENSVIHLLDKDGNFLQFILSADHGLQSPLGLSVDTASRLWVCSRGNSKILRIKYV